MSKPLVLAIAVVAAAAWLGFGSASEPAIELVSVSEIGKPAEGVSLSPAVSAGGRFVAFASDATNIVLQDENSFDIFVYDRLRGPGDPLVSVASDQTQANAAALFPAISGDGRYVVFQSDADNLTPNDTNESTDIFLRDRTSMTTTRVSVASGGAEGSSDSLTPAISADGRYVTFTSLADSLVADDANMDRDVFVRDRLMFTTELVSVATDGTHGNFASGGLGAGPARVTSDGRFVAFGSFANNLVSDDGNSRDDAFIRDRDSGVTERVSVSSEEAEGSGHSYYPSASDNGRYVVFYSDANDLVPDDGNGVSDVFLRDRLLGMTTRLSNGMAGEEANGASSLPVISADGRFVAFQSSGSNLVPDDTSTTDIFLLDRYTGVIERLTNGDGASLTSAISAEHAVVAFQSTASDLVPNDSNMRSDVFVWGKSLVPPPTPTPDCSGGGDANDDGTTNSLDALAMLQYAAGLVTMLPDLEAADVNDDGLITSIDAALTLQFSAGLLLCLPP